MLLKIGSEVSNTWRILRFLKRGGQAHIYLVQHKSGGTYAMKVISVKKDARGRKNIKRFAQEIEILRSLSEENRIIQIYDTNINEVLRKASVNWLYYVMEFAQYGTLVEIRRNFPKDPLERILRCLKLFREICLGIECAHRREVVHRDIKPTNILFINSPSDMRVADFGVALLKKSPIRVTAKGEWVGARGFMSPQQTADPSKVKFSDDIYSLGLLLYYMLSSISVQSLAGRVVAGTIVPICQIYTEPRVLPIDQLVQKMIVADERLRFESLAPVINVLDYLIGWFSSWVTSPPSSLEKKVLNEAKSFLTSKNLIQRRHHFSNFYRLLTSSEIATRLEIFLASFVGFALRSTEASLRPYLVALLGEIPPKWHIFYLDDLPSLIGEIPEDIRAGRALEQINDLMKAGCLTQKEALLIVDDLRDFIYSIDPWADKIAVNFRQILRFLLLVKDFLPLAEQKKMASLLKTWHLLIGDFGDYAVWAPFPDVKAVFDTVSKSYGLSLI